MQTLRVIIITTGNEITDGDILNTTGPAIAKRLVEHGQILVKHILLPDDENAIAANIKLALQDSDIIITTGGLGPTSDDRTRFALATAIDQPLVFDETSWQMIVNRLNAIHLHVHPDNRQQALFPSDATIFPNANGTANGCGVTIDDKSVFMLPGPPHECLPMFEHDILPRLPQHHRPKLHWLLFGVSEGETAAMLDAALHTYTCQTGYRAEYPYLEFKVWADDAEVLEKIAAKVTPLLEDSLVNKINDKASDIVIKKLIANDCHYKIFDQASRGLLQATITTPDTCHKIEFVNDEKHADIILTGLAEYWQGQAAPAKTHLVLKFNHQSIQRECFYRGDRVKKFAVEWACWQLLKNQFFV